MKPMPNLMETELESFGASVVEDFTWKQLLDTDACTMCGRCTSVCPAHATGKPLDPREIVLKVGEVMAATGSPGRDTAARHRPRHHDRRQLGVRAHHRRGDLGVHELQGVRRDLPRQHRDPRQDPRHAPVPVADGVELPGRARQRLPGDGEPVEPVGAEPGRARRLGEGPRQRHGRRSRRTAAVRVPLLGRLRRQLRRQEQEGHPGDGEAAVAGRHRRGDPRPERDVHRRSGAAIRQRVPVPDAGDAQHRDAQRDGREEDHHAVPALLQHAAQRVPATRRELRGDPPHPAPRAAHRRRPARRQPGDARGAPHLSRLVLPRPPQRRLPRAAQGRRLDQGDRGRRDAAQRHQGHVLRCRWRADVDGGVDRHQGQRRTRPRGARRPARPGSPPPARSASSCSTTA